MTTTIKVQSHNHPALVITTDKVGGEAKTEERIIVPADGEVTLHCTTTRAISIVDLSCDDPRVAALEQPDAA